MHQVFYRGRLSTKLLLLFGVRQGSVLDPILFILYAAELFHVITACGFAAHSYADDTQVYISVPASDHSDAMRRLSDCMTQIRDWMASNRLKLNEDKTQVIWLGTRQQLTKVTAHVLALPNATVQLSTAVNDLGVMLDSQLAMADHVAALCDPVSFNYVS